MSEEAVYPGIKTWNHPSRKFDIQFEDGKEAQRQFAEILGVKKIERLEVKTQTKQWEETGNIPVEFMCAGKKSGISTTTAEYYVWTMRNRKKVPLAHVLIDVERMKALARRAIREKRVSHKAGDDKKFSVALVPVAWLLDPTKP